MQYDGRRPGNGWWNCTYSPEWVERMKRAVRVCERLTAEQVEAALTRTEIHYVLPPGDFLSEEQDVRGLPLSLCREYEKRHKGRPMGMEGEFTIKKENMSKQETMAVGGVFEEFTLNSNGVKIKKCCASCAHHEPYNSEGTKRLCKKHTMIKEGKEKPKVVDKSDLCRDWSISDMINGIKLNK